MCLSAVDAPSLSFFVSLFLSQSLSFSLFSQPLSFSFSLSFSLCVLLVVASPLPMSWYAATMLSLPLVWPPCVSPLFLQSTRALSRFCALSLFLSLSLSPSVCCLLSRHHCQCHGTLRQCFLRLSFGPHVCLSSFCSRRALSLDFALSLSVLQAWYLGITPPTPLKNALPRTRPIDQHAPTNPHPNTRGHATCP